MSLTSKVCPKFHVRRCYSINHVRFRVKMLKLKIYIVILGQAAVTRSFCLEQGSFLYILCKNRKLEWNRKVYLNGNRCRFRCSRKNDDEGGKETIYPLFPISLCDSIALLALPVFLYLLKILYPSTSSIKSSTCFMLRKFLYTRLF